MPSEPASAPILPPVTPSACDWHALGVAERESFLRRVIAALTEASEAMGEGQPHYQAKARLLDSLGLYFRTIGRSVYLASELAVLYPGERAFAPDLLAVIDVAQPEDDARHAWIVADEGKGIDLALEVLHLGNRTKDLVDNVERCARLGIPEYFVYDRGAERVIGYRLPTPEARRYQRIVPQAGRVRSSVLGLELSVEAGRLKLFHGTSELYGSSDFIGRLSGMLESLGTKVEEAEERAESALASAAALIEGLRATLLAALAARGIAISDGVHARIRDEADPAVLQGWILRVFSASEAGDIFS